MQKIQGWSPIGDARQTKQNKKNCQIKLYYCYTWFWFRRKCKVWSDIWLLLAKMRHTQRGRFGGLYAFHRTTYISLWYCMFNIFILSCHFSGLLSPLSWTTAADVVLILLSVIAEGIATCCPRWWDWRLYNETRSNGVRDCHHKNTERDRASLSSWLKFRNKKRKIDDKIDENNTQKMLKLINQIYLGVN